MAEVQKEQETQKETKVTKSLAEIDPTAILFWALIIVLIIILLCNCNCKPKSYSEQSEPYFSGRPDQITVARQIARQEQGASINEGKYMGEMDLQYELY